MSFPKYPAYKDSGVEWLGSVPEHWLVDRLKASITSCRNGIWGDEAQADENDIPCVRVADFDRQKLRVQLQQPTIRNVTEKERVNRVLKRGDLLLEKSGGGENQPVGCVVLYDDEQPAVCSNFVAKVELAPGMDSSYWRYVHAAAYAVRLTIGSINQTSGIQNLDQDRYFNERAAFPSTQEQIAIGTFLDRETTKIDALVAEQEQLITLLKEKRQAVISHAVTKGLDLSAPMKDSGVEWLGEVPVHWHISAIKHICDVRDGTHDTPQFLTPAADTFPFVTTKDLGSDRVSFDEAKHISREDYENFSRRSRVDPGDVLMPMIGSIGGAVLVDTDEPFAIKNIALFKRSDRFDPRWLAHFLNSDLSSVQFALNRSGGVQGFVALSVLRDLRIPVPPKIEQVEIADSLSKALANINDLIGLASESIATLQERRSALISAAVTGQIDIRGENNGVKS